MRATSLARLTPPRQGPCLKGPSCSIHIALTCAAIPQRAVAGTIGTPGPFAALRPTPRARRASQFEREFCKKLYGISPQRPVPAASHGRYGRAQGERRRAVPLPLGPGEDRHGGQGWAGAAALASRECEPHVRSAVTHALPSPRPHGSAHGRPGSRRAWRMARGVPACPGTARAGWPDAGGALGMMPAPLARGLDLQACSSKAERCYHMAEVGGSIPSAPTSFARLGARRGCRRPAAASGRFLRPAGRTPCSERAT